MVELLRRMAAKASSVDLMEGFSISREGPVVPFIQFADDSLFLLKAEVEGMCNLRCIFLIMEAVSGLKVNLAKSSISPVGVCCAIGEIASVLGCDIAHLLIMYLGLPLGAKASSKELWNLVVEKVGRRLVSWKGHYLSKGGKLILLKSVLSSIPTYYLSVF